MAVNATAVWRVRPSGSNSNGGGFDTGISGYGTDYSQQNSAQASGTAGTATGTTTFSDAIANAFTSAMVGNALYLTGTGLTTGWYFVTGYTSASTVTLDSSPGTGTTGTWYLGGAWADFWTNVTTSVAVVAPGNTIYVLGSGVPNPSSYVYDYTSTTYYTVVSGSQSAGQITLAGDPATPGGGVPCIKTNGNLYYFASCWNFKNLWVVLSGTSNLGLYGVFNCSLAYYNNNVFDQYGYDGGVIVDTVKVINCEFFSSQTPGSAGTGVAVTCGTSGNMVTGCNFHDLVGGAILVQNVAAVEHNIISNCRGDAIQVVAGSGNHMVTVANNTIDATARTGTGVNGTGNGINFTSQTALNCNAVYNNIISNIVTSGKYGITVAAGTAAANDFVKMIVDYNTFYNVATKYNNISAGAHDVALGSTPYTASSTENYAPVTGVYGTGLTLTFPQHTPGMSSNTSPTTPGAVPPPTGGGGTTYVINKIQNIYLGDPDYGA